MKPKEPILIRVPDLGQVCYPVHREIQDKFHTMEVMAKEIIKVIPAKKSIVFFCRGTSGIIFATFMVNYLYNFNRDIVAHIEYVQKPEEDRHDSSKTPPKLLSSKNFNVIVDDFMASGLTLQKVYQRIQESIKTVDLLCLTGEIFLEKIHFPVKTFIAKNFSGEYRGE